VKVPECFVVIVRVFLKFLRSVASWDSSRPTGVMDVDRFSFSSQLGALLEAIAKAHFVAFDLELSGIQSRQFSPTDAPHGGKHTLQNRYVELKAAAERYQVLQVGLTCVEQDSETGALK